jgi:predicted acetyltransferase
MGFLPMGVYYSALEKGNIFVYKINGKIAGFILFRKMKDDCIRVIQMACPEDFLRRGIGTALFKKVESLSNGKIILTAIKENKNAIEFYSSMGMGIKEQDEKFVHMIKGGK